MMPRVLLKPSHRPGQKCPRWSPSHRGGAKTARGARTCPQTPGKSRAWAGLTPGPPHWALPVGQDLNIRPRVPGRHRQPSHARDLRSETLVENTVQSREGGPLPGFGACAHHAQSGQSQVGSPTHRMLSGRAPSQTCMHSLPRLG